MRVMEDKAIYIHRQTGVCSCFNALKSTYYTLQQQCSIAKPSAYSSSFELFELNTSCIRTILCIILNVQQRIWKKISTTATPRLRKMDIYRRKKINSDKDYVIEED